ncbi:oxysterol-binding protein-like protein 1 [Glonium stellatum]|uniref:Oxysterol-binding protein-like protein 1 n=1 Tax=Glonium stellatum TaxID=574774 RepID=A0A8E2JRH0_9PEZI|nr:oxysterol-binding protein-like protein 1 [Glonium stellatum]
MADSTAVPSGAAIKPSPAPSIASSTDPSRAPTPANGPAEKVPDDSSKLRTFLGILRRFMGVADIAAVRFSLPAQLLEPTPNLEYWNYLDRPEAFISIGDSDEPLGRILGTLRFWFTKDLKYVKGKPCKPYNSTLGEFFRCNWEVEDTAPPIKHGPGSKPSSSATSTTSNKSVKVSFLTEQTSHHPPVSAFYIDCPEKGIIARGFDQISAKFTGTSIRVVAGAHNLGIFIELKNRGEQYHLTHPAAHLGGLLRGSLSVTVTDSCFITCAKTRIKVILQYLEEGWLGKTQNKVEGVVFTYDPENDNKTKIKDVPEKDVLARIEGCWTDKVYYTLGSQPFAKSAEKILLIDLNPLFPVAKFVPPIDDQLPNESRRFWSGVTEAILNKQYSLATQLKQELEERQREKAADRKTKGVDWQPRFFTGATTPVGKPNLTKDGEEVLKGLHMNDFKLEPNKELGA